MTVSFSLREARLERRKEGDRKSAKNKAEYPASNAEGGKERRKKGRKNKEAS